VGLGPGGPGSGDPGGAPRQPRFLQFGGEYDPRPLRERTRSRLAQALVGALILVTLGLVVLTAFDAITVDEAKDLAVAVLSPLVAITGTALGFYFGGRKDGD
jgi:hypothetical protein